MILDTFGLISRCWSNLNEYGRGYGFNAVQVGHKKEVLIAWNFPEFGSLKFNTDGSCWKNGNAAGGGVLRDATGKWIVGFAHNLGKVSITHAELYAIFDALCIAKRLQIASIVVESDSKVAISLINNDTNAEHPHVGLIKRIRKLMSSGDWICQICHVFREANSVADWLANYAHSLPREIVEFGSCPSDCVARAVADLSGACFSRLGNS